MNARARIHAMFPLDEAAEGELNTRLDDYADAILRADGQDYPGEVTALRGLVAALAAVAQHGDLDEVRKLLTDHAVQDAAAREDRMVQAGEGR